MIDWDMRGRRCWRRSLASLVEFVEALTVVLAVAPFGLAIGARRAGLALLTLAILVIALGPALARIPWRRSSSSSALASAVRSALAAQGILRAAGIIALQMRDGGLRSRNGSAQSQSAALPRRLGYNRRDGLVQDRHARGYRGCLHRHRHRCVSGLLVPAGIGAASHCCWSLRSVSPSTGRWRAFREHAEVPRRPFCSPLSRPSGWAKAPA